MILSRYRRIQLIVTGVSTAAICLTIMALPYTLQPGLVFDTRSILISVTALVFGPVPAAITTAAALAFRISAGGIGTLPGVSVITSCALIGLAWRRWMYPKTMKWRWLNTYLMSMIVHLVMLACMLLLPYPNNIDTIRAIALPVLVIYPVTSMLLSMLLMRQSDTRQLQKQLEQSEERFRVLFEQAPLGYQSLDEDGRILTVNRQWLDMMEYTRDEVIGRKFSDFLSPEFLEFYDQKFSEFKKQGYCQCELEILTKAGKPLYISHEGKIRYGNNNEIIQSHCILKDITLQKAAQDQLRVSEENYRRLFETMAQGVVYQSADGEIISANPAAERVLGMTLDQMRGKTSMDPHWQAIREDGTEMSGNDHPNMVALRTGKPFGPFVMGVFQPQISERVWLSVYATPLFRPGEKKPYQAYALFEDITAERKARHDYRTLFNRMMDAFAVHEIICDEQGKPVDYRFLAANPAFEAMTGLKADDIIGKSVRDVIPDIEPFWIETYAKVALTGEPVKFENFSSGLGKHYAISAYRPKPMQFACTFTDITQLVRAEKEAKENLLRLQGLLENSLIPIIIFDSKGRCIEASSYVYKMLSTSKEELRNKDVSQFLPKDIADKVLETVSQKQTDENIFEGLQPLELPNGERFFESRFFAIPVADNSEKLFGYIGIDVTERILAEQALHESEKRYASYIENAPTGILIINDKGQVIETNAATGKVSGYTGEELQKMELTDFIAAGSLDKVLQLLKELADQGAVNGDLQIKHKDGSARWVNVRAVKLSEDRFLCFVSDITEQKTATEKLIYANTHDAMTGLVNRRYFAREAEQLNVPEQMPLSIILADINGLKLINDSFGFDEGDRVIVQTAEFLRGFCREGDILARTGGDDFSFLLPRTDFRKAMEILYNIQEACGEYNAQISNASLHISLALGAGTKETIDDDWVEANKQADNYLFQRKLLEQKSSHSSILATIKATMMEKSHETEAHEERMAEMARKVGTSMGLSEGDLNNMELLAELHDIGKVGISEQVLNKPGKLNEEEWAEMKKHPEIGERIAMSASSLAPIANYILCHHERWDGSGYPQGLKGSEIPLLSRILSVVDAYDAMTQDRVYQKAVSHEEAIEEIKRCAGTQFDPQVTKIFCEEVFGE
ncbi:MAG: PAS domain S-box protein [Clostridiales bacterium]|nr:PAS domain S-box protein [Clostridiales bacterium]